MKRAISLGVRPFIFLGLETIFSFSVYFSFASDYFLLISLISSPFSSKKSLGGMREM